jgi:D-methionine transport system ATP-binding protein
MRKAGNGMIELKHLTKTFRTPSGTLDALKDINLTIEDGDIYGIVGMSGAGKSTLVRCINLLERPTEGQVIVNGRAMEQLSAKELRVARRDITMIFQQFNLLMQRTCLKNICFPLEIAGIKKEEAVARARELLELVGLPDKADAYPAQLSGGQMQRIAIARALATDPKVLLCDEATSALDPNTTHAILRLIREINAKLGITVVVITHQMQVVEEICNRVAILDHGTVAEEGQVSDIFANPKSEAAKRLVFPTDLDVPLPENEKETRIRLVFGGADATGTPLIATIAKEKNILLNILSASTRTIDGKIYGNMLLGVPNESNALAETLTYLRAIPDLTVEEV